MARPGDPKFLARAGYRRRRLADAARLVPIVGAVLMLVPVLWPETGTRTSSAMIYVFTVWAVLIVVIGLMSRRLGRMMRDPDPGARPGAADDKG